MTVQVFLTNYPELRITRERYPAAFFSDIAGKQMVGGNSQTQARAHPAHATCSSAHELTLIEAAERPSIERFIAAAYASAYDAQLTSFMPTLAALTRRGLLIGACGLRYAQDERLFLETYLDVPIEQRLGEQAGARVPRTAIVEVGNFATARPGAARSLIALLTRYLSSESIAWTVFTAVPALRNNFLRMNIPVKILGP